MVVQHNMSAMNANRMLSGVSSAQSKSTSAEAALRGEQLQPLLV